MCTYFRFIFPILFICSSFSAQAQAQENSLTHYGSNNQVWLNKLQALAQGKAVKFRILQLGDSHTAADFFSNAARERLQKEFGSAGIGWIYPNKVRLQNSESVSYEGYKNWQTLTSHRDNDDFPLGGVLTKPNNYTTLTIRPKKLAENTSSTLIFSTKAPHQGAVLHIHDSNGKINRITTKSPKQQWTYTYIKATPPINIRTQDTMPWILGPINIENSSSGIIYSAMGINGAQLHEVNKWRSDWLDDLKRTQADLIILAYGTNEAFNQPFNYADTRQTWQQIIRKIKQTLPNAGILIIGAPESLKSTKGICGTPPTGLNSMQEIQQQLAMKNGLLYWSWQEMMGGKCSMKTWISKKLGRKDGIHFTMTGYAIAGNELAKAIIQIAHAK